MFWARKVIGPTLPAVKNFLKFCNKRGLTFVKQTGIIVVLENRVGHELAWMKVLEVHDSLPSFRCYIFI